MVTKNYSVRFDPALMARVDAQALGRSAFIRDAVEAALDGGSQKNSNIPSEDQVVGKSHMAPSGRLADQDAVLAVVQANRFTSRQVAGALSWLGLRYENAEKALLASGAVAVEDGILVATEACDVS